MRPTAIRLGLPVLLLVAALVTPACQTQTIEFGSIREPILLNSDPVLGGASAERRETIEPYYAEAKRTAMASSSVKYNPQPGQTYTDESQHSVKNDVQQVAFYKVVGHKDRCLTDIEIEMRGFGLNMLVALYARIHIFVRGNVTRLRPESGEVP